MYLNKYEWLLCTSNFLISSKIKFSLIIPPCSDNYFIRAAHVIPATTYITSAVKSQKGEK